MLKNNRAETVLAHHPGPNHNPTFAGGAAMADQQSNIPEKSTQEIPYGYCHCGCGQLTTLAQRSKPKKKIKVGQPNKFLPQHHKRLEIREKNSNWAGGTHNRKGYVMVLCPNHLNANKNGYISEHILIAEKALGKLLPNKAQIHHANGIKSDNRTPFNIIICQDRKYHSLLEQRARAYYACGHANWRKCWICQKWDAPDNLVIYGRHAQHRDCKLKYRRNYENKEK